MYEPAPFILISRSNFQLPLKRWSFRTPAIIVHGHYARYLIRLCIGPFSIVEVVLGADDDVLFLYYRQYCKELTALRQKRQGRKHKQRHELYEVARSDWAHRVLSF